MKYTITTGDCADIYTDCIVVGVYAPNKLTPSAIAVDQAAGGLLKRLSKRGDIEGTSGHTLLIPCEDHLRAPRLLVVGLGDANQLDADEFSAAIRSAATALQRTGATNAAVTLVDAKVKQRDVGARTRIIVEAFAVSRYRFDRLKSKKIKSKNNALSKIIVPVQDKSSVAAVRRSVHEGEAVSSGIQLARDLSNLPGNICTPSYLAEQARKLQRSHKLKVSILSESQMKSLKMGSLLSVTRGSREPAKLIIMEYRGGSRSSPPVVLVGKGLTFDAGGISLKPAGKMDEMKYDMCGGASVFGTLLATAELKLPLNVIGIVPSCENLPDGAANKPGDIVKSMSGQTIEILNTDAEGRLILCDALTYARRFKPDVIIDIATLTGACVIALGNPASGLFSNNEQLAKGLLEAGESSGDRAWRLPLWKQYQKQLNSPFADIANIGSRGGGAITAACFLSRFTVNLNWAHLDIAGTAYHSGNNKGATGRPVGLLTQFLIQRSR
jgi:leucyl aminopeptidase